MSKIIKLTDDIIEKAKEEFENLLTTGKFADGKISYSYNLNNINRKASLIFEELAWLKMQELIQEFSTEIAWNGIAYRGDDDEYIVKDIVVFPQIVSGVTVDRDKEEWAKWCAELDDETLEFRYCSKCEGNFEYCSDHLYTHEHVKRIIPGANIKPEE